MGCMKFFPTKFEVFLVFWSFLCVSLNVLVSLLNFICFFEKTHQHTQTYIQKWAKYKQNFIFKWERVTHTTCTIFLNFYLCPNRINSPKGKTIKIPIKLSCGRGQTKHIEYFMTLFPHFQFERTSHSAVHVYSILIKSHS